mmetsp:Transcript_58069/g.165332  ORF Transcript_58069/g.165332 Transcript_58069/m.165332 type:complete len:216 (+) Transcript_58069:1040-1687(+)
MDEAPQPELLPDAGAAEPVTDPAIEAPRNEELLEDTEPEKDAPLQPPPTAWRATWAPPRLALRSGTAVTRLRAALAAAAAARAAPAAPATVLVVLVPPAAPSVAPPLEWWFAPAGLVCWARKDGGAATNDCRGHMPARAHQATATGPSLSHRRTRAGIWRSVRQRLPVASTAGALPAAGGTISASLAPAELLLRACARGGRGGERNAPTPLAEAA